MCKRMHSTSQNALHDCSWCCSSSNSSATAFTICCCFCCFCCFFQYINFSRVNYRKYNIQNGINNVTRMPVETKSAKHFSFCFYTSPAGRIRSRGQTFSDAPSTVPAFPAFPGISFSSACRLRLGIPRRTSLCIWIFPWEEVHCKAFCNAGNLEGICHSDTWLVECARCRIDGFPSVPFRRQKSACQAGRLGSPGPHFGFDFCSFFCLQPMGCLPNWSTKSRVFHSRHAKILLTGQRGSKESSFTPR